MPLFSKSIQEASSLDDGVRICIMRKPNFDAEWDIWMPTLAPSLSLLKAYLNNEVDWSEYVSQFHHDVIVENSKHMKLLVDMARTNTITVLCWEELPTQCHRKLVLEEASRLDPGLKIVIR